MVVLRAQAKNKPSNQKNSVDFDMEVLLFLDNSSLPEKYAKFHQEKYMMPAILENNLTKTYFLLPYIKNGHPLQRKIQPGDGIFSPHFPILKDKTKTEFRKKKESPCQNRSKLETTVPSLADQLDLPEGPIS